ncbi:TadE/TadG family type IV pilus assembly protein [Sphingomonas sp. SUN039]|uniref:TadE/TadG family type IV pilus assembly protein n=1 Tax=Sphingomonas sp. SUN039 TaxID=2937787 RepID=UPI00216433C7|nr:TadE/TadG family type IV pilus assembly protein [Sphingomonas sp. SUN039]UVO53221.1 pilus assembly protein [Sphingomonas sp. SUN039]
MKFSPATQGVPREYSGILTRLRRDTSGNTLAMIAMATIPLAGMVGSAVDIGRSYLIKSRLQQACDAGVLAARRSMAGATLDSNSSQLGSKFFNTNFATGTAGATNIAFTPAATSDGQVEATATARVPMTITKIFGTEYIDLAVQCEAKLEISNTDVMMVLDVTGSMANCPDDSNCGSGPGSKIVGLRSAVLDFYDTINNATSSDARFRIGFVPYSAAVNVGLDPFTNQEILPLNWMVDNWTYQSRTANMTTPGYHPTTTYNGWTNQNYGSTISNTNCTAYGNNLAFSGFSPNPAGNPTLPTNDVFQQSGAPATVTQVFYERVSNTYSGNQTCTRRYRTATTSYALNGRYGFTSWDYKPVSYDVSTMRTGTVVNVYAANATPTGSVPNSGSYDMVALVNTPGSTVPGQSSVYDGCVEERDTVAQATYATIPSGAWDMDILTTPFNNATMWRPMWPELVYDRDTTATVLNTTTNRPAISEYGSAQPNPWRSVATWCPVAASKLAVRARADVQNYVNSLVANGNTFHDLGMAWGARLLSPTGMWASENTTAPNGKPISRHLIFMTDGDMVTPPSIYNAHGFEEIDRRVSGSGNTPSQSDLINRHNARFVAMCNAARANNMTIWTIAFGTSNPPNLVSCADSGKSYVATDTASLRAQFQAIASQIAELRLAR